MNSNTTHTWYTHTNAHSPLNNTCDRALIRRNLLLQAPILDTVADANVPIGQGVAYPVDASKVEILHEPQEFFEALQVQLTMLHCHFVCANRV
jgi:hypothetical protein